MLKKMFTGPVAIIVGSSLGGIALVAISIALSKWAERDVNAKSVVAYTVMDGRVCVTYFDPVGKPTVKTECPELTFKKE